MYYLCFDKEEAMGFVSAGRFVAVTPNLHPRRKLNDAVLLFGMDGECPMWQDGREYTLRKGDYMLLFPKHIHKGSNFTNKGQSHFWCHFSLPKGFYITEEFEAESDEICVLPEFSHTENVEKYFILFSQLIDAAEEGGSDRIIEDAYLKILLNSLSKEYLKESNDKKQMVASRLKDWVGMNEYKDLSVAAAAGALGYNPNYLSKVIKQETGFSPIEYINILRLKRAKNLLLNSNMKICEIAFSVGFSDEKYFAKVFKKYENLTPSGFREAYFRRNINVK